MQNSFIWARVLSFISCLTLGNVCKCFACAMTRFIINWDLLVYVFCMVMTVMNMLLVHVFCIVMTIMSMLLVHVFCMTIANTILQDTHSLHCNYLLVSTIHMHYVQQWITNYTCMHVYLSIRGAVGS